MTLTVPLVPQTPSPLPTSLSQTPTKQPTSQPTMVGQTPKPMIQPTSHPPSLPSSPTVIPKSEPIVQLSAESFAPVPSLENPIVRLSNPPTSAPTSLNVTTVVEKYLPRKPPRTSSSAKKQLRIYHSFRWCSAVRQFILDMCLWVLDIVAGKSHTAQNVIN